MERVPEHRRELVVEEGEQDREILLVEEAEEQVDLEREHKKR